jgi:hypothetical protein
MQLGFFESLTMVGALAVAVPMVYAGSNIYLAGNSIGLLFVALGVAMVLAERFLTTPFDIPSIVAKKTVGRFIPDPDEADSDAPTEHE